MESIFEKLWRLGPAAYVLKAIVAAIAADGLLLGFILLRRTYRKRYFAKRDARVFELRQKWEALISGELPFEAWRKKSFDRRIVETIALDAFEAAGPEESARLLKFLRESGLIEKRIFEARQLTGWRRMKALVALVRTRAPEGIAALAEGLRDGDLEIRLVWCLQRFFTFGDFTHDCFNGGAPYKDFGVLVVSANVLVDRLDQLRNVFERAPANTFVGDLPEPTLHHIEPGTRRWNKVQMKPWVT